MVHGLCGGKNLIKGSYLLSGKRWDSHTEAICPQARWGWHPLGRWPQWCTRTCTASPESGSLASTWTSSSCSRSPPQSVAPGAKQRGRHSIYSGSGQSFCVKLRYHLQRDTTNYFDPIHTRITIISVLDLDIRLPPSLCLRHPHTAPCLSSCCHPGPRSHRPRSPQRIWERHAGSRPGCWALTSQSRLAALSLPPRHRTPTHCQSGLPTGSLGRGTGPLCPGWTAELQIQQCPRKRTKAGLMEQ